MGIDTERVVDSKKLADLEELICVYCQDLVVPTDAQQAPCGHVFCRECVLQDLALRLSCPKDRENMDRATLRPLKDATPILYRMLGKTFVRCKRYLEGCKWQGEFSDLDAHERACTAIFHCTCCTEGRRESQELLAARTSQIERLTEELAAKDSVCEALQKDVASSEQFLMQAQENIRHMEQRMHEMSDTGLRQVQLISQLERKVESLTAGWEEAEENVRRQKISADNAHQECERLKEQHTENTLKVNELHAIQLNQLQKRLEDSKFVEDMLRKRVADADSVVEQHQKRVEDLEHEAALSATRLLYHSKQFHVPSLSRGFSHAGDGRAGQGLGSSGAEAPSELAPKPSGPTASDSFGNGAEASRLDRNGSNDMIRSVATGKEPAFYQGSASPLDRHRMSPATSLVEQTSPRSPPLSTGSSSVRSEDSNWDSKSNLQCQKIVLTGHNDTVRALAFGPDGTLWSASSDKTLRGWNEEGQCIATLPLSSKGMFRRSMGHELDVLAVAVGEDGTVWSAGQDKSIRVWEQGACTTILKGHSDAVLALAMSPEGELWSAGMDKSIRRWKSGNVVATLERHTGPVFCLLVAPDGALASGSGDWTIIWWRENTIRTVLRGHKAPVYALALGLDGTLWSASADKTIKGWRDGTCVATLKGHTSWVLALAITRDGTLWSGSQDNKIKGWRDGHCIATLEGHKNWVSSLAAGRDGSLWSGSWDNSVRGWHVQGQVPT